MSTSISKRVFPYDVESLQEQAEKLFQRLSLLSAYRLDGRFDERTAERWNQIAIAMKQNIENRDRLVELLQKQIDLLTNERVMLQPYETMLLPGQILQNETRVDWEMLRTRFGIVADRPVGEYQREITDLLREVIDPEMDADLTYGEAISTDRPENPADEIIVVRALAVNGLCRKLPVAVLLAKFYWSWF